MGARDPPGRRGIEGYPATSCVLLLEGSGLSAAAA